MDVLANFAAFNDAAADIFSSLYTAFEQELCTVKRTGNENVYQLQKAKYLVELKHRLEKLASSLIEKSESDSVRETLGFGLRERIEFYLREFMQKSERL